MLLSKRKFAALITAAESGTPWSCEDALLVAGYLQRTIDIASKRRDQLRGVHRALKNASTRAHQHHVDGDPEQSIKTMRSGVRTAYQWIDGTHPRLLAGHDG
jgi:hypothetical protein